MTTYNFSDPFAAVDAGYARGNALRQDRAAYTAGNALRAGDYAGAANAYYDAGMNDAGQQLQQRQASQQQAKQADLAKTVTDIVGRVADVHRNGGNAVEAWNQLAPQLLSRGESEDEIAQVRQHLQADPDNTLLTLGAGAAKEAGYEVRNAGDEVLVINPRTGGIVNRFRGGKTVNLSDGQTPYYVPGSGGVSAAPAAARPPMSEQPGVQPTAPAMSEQPTSAPAADAVWKSIKTQESGGQASPGTAVGPDTAYGNALGSTQMLPATAEAMARKVGVPWNPALMRENTPRALAYQDQLGRAYFQEGLDKSGGDPAQAAAYYFAGPDPALHGPKTRAYVQQVMARAGQAGEQPPLQGGSGGDALADDVPQMIPLRAPQKKPTARPATAEEKAAYGIAANVPAQMKPDGSIDVIAGAAGGMSPKEQRTASIQLRKEFDQQADVKAFQTVATQYDVISRLAKAAPTAPNDVSMIFAYMKVLDPTSVVREGEFATAQNTTGLPGQVVNAYNKALNGQRLSPQQRQQFTEAADRIYSANKNRYDQLVGQYQGYSKELGLPETTIQPRVAVNTGVPATPSVPAGAVAALKRDPRLAGQFDAKYGKGSAARALGGR